MNLEKVIQEAIQSLGASSKEYELAWAEISDIITRLDNFEKKWGPDDMDILSQAFINDIESGRKYLDGVGLNLWRLFNT